MSIHMWLIQGFSEHMYFILRCKSQYKQSRSGTDIHPFAFLYELLMCVFPPAITQHPAVFTAIFNPLMFNPNHLWPMILHDCAVVFMYDNKVRMAEVKQYLWNISLYSVLVDPDRINVSKE